MVGIDFVTWIVNVNYPGWLVIYKPNRKKAPIHHTSFPPPCLPISVCPPFRTKSSVIQCVDSQTFSQWERSCTFLEEPSQHWILCSIQRFNMNNKRFVGLFWLSAETQQALTSFTYQYSQSGRKLRGTQPNTPWAAGSWSDTCSAAAPSSRSPLKPGRWHQVAGRRLLCSALAACLFMSGLRVTSHRLWYGCSVSTARKGEQLNLSDILVAEPKTKQQSAAPVLWSSAGAELDLVAALMRPVLEGLTSPPASIK